MEIRTAEIYLVLNSIDAKRTTFNADPNAVIAGLGAALESKLRKFGITSTFSSEHPMTRMAQ
jgi:hypothetical protein